MPVMEYQQTKIARRYEGDPELGPILANGQRRALLGWNHFRDNPNGLRSGKLWCWTSAAPGIDPPRHKLQVFDTSGNRAPFPGMRVDCGVANFSMVRLIHPYWCPNNHIPQDMNGPDKAQLRGLYHELIAKELTQYANGDDDDDSGSDDDGNDDNARRVRREYRDFNAEENRVLLDADEEGTRYTKAFKNAMAQRNAAAMRDQFHGIRRQRRAARDARERRRRTRNTSSARATADRRSDSSGITRRRTTRALEQRRQARMRQEQQDRKTGAPGSEWEEEDDGDEGDEGDIMHGGEEEAAAERQRQRDALGQMAIADANLDLDFDFDLDLNSSAVNDDDVQQDDEVRQDDDDDDDRDDLSSSSHKMFVDQASDINSNAGDNGSHSPPHSSAQSFVIDLTAFNASQQEGETEPRSASPKSNTSNRSIKAEVDVKPVVDTGYLKAIYDGTDPDILEIRGFTKNTTFKFTGEGSADNPVSFDE